MLEELRVDNFLSWLNLSFKPREMNLLVGLNNTGKTNLCKALQFLSYTTWFKLDTCAAYIQIPIHNLTNASYEKSTIDFTIRARIPGESEEREARYEYRLTLSVPTSPMPSPTIEVETEKLTVSDDSFDDVVLLDSTRSEVRLLHEVDYTKGKENYKTTYAPRDATMLQRLYDQQINARANRFKRYLSSWQYYALSQASLRGTVYKPNETWLDSYGANLASVIHNLKKTDEKSYRKLLEYTQLLEPDIDFINFGGGDTEPQVFMYFEHKTGLKLPAWTASSGTLRFVAMAYVLLVQPALEHRPLLMIEEPENGIFVGHLKEILEMATQWPNAPQLIFTSHSPYFIDFFDNRLDSVFVLQRDEHHSTISNIDTAKAKKLLAEEFSLGEQHFRNMLR